MSNESFRFSSDKNLLNLDDIHSLLVNAYWCKGIPKEVLKKAIDSSLCFGVYKKDKQVGFARVVTDHATFAWVCDVIINENFRGLGLSKELMKHIMSHLNSMGLRRICLATKDAHELYKKFNFKVTENPTFWMEIKDNEIYLRQMNIKKDTL